MGRYTGGVKNDWGPAPQIVKNGVQKYLARTARKISLETTRHGYFSVKQVKTS